MPRDYHEHKRTSRHRFRDFSHMKLTDLIKSLRRRRFRAGKNVPHRSPLTFSRSFPVPFADHDSSLIQTPLPYLSTSPGPTCVTSLYRSEAVSIRSATGDVYLAGSGTSNFGSDDGPPNGEKGLHFSQRRPVSAFPTSPSLFQLRSASTKDYLVERLEEHLRQLKLSDASSESDRATIPQNTSRDILMDVCWGSPDLEVSSQCTIDLEQSSSSTPPDGDGQRNAASLLHDQNVVPMIVVTSVDAKHARPLPPSNPRPSRTPFGPFNLIHDLTNLPFTQPKLKLIPDDPFTTQTDDLTCPPNFNLTFRLPSLPSSYPSPARYAPETPTPMCCDHFGDCKGDLWEVLHPPLVSGRFTLPPFELPPLSAGLFDDTHTLLPC